MYNSQALRSIGIDLKSAIGEDVIHVHADARDERRQVLARLVLELPDALIRIRERERLEERLAAALDDLALRVSLFGDASPRDFRSFRAVVAQEKDTTERVRELLLDLREKVGVHLDLPGLFVHDGQANLLPRRLRALRPLIGRSNVDDDEPASQRVLDVGDGHVRLLDVLRHRGVRSNDARARRTLGRIFHGGARGDARGREGVSLRERHG